MAYKPVDYVEGTLDAVCRVRGIAVDGSDAQRLRGEDLIYASFARQLLTGHPAFHKMYFDRTHPASDESRHAERQVHTVKLPANYSYLKPVQADG